MFDFVEDTIPETFGKQLPNPFRAQIEQIKGTDRSRSFTITKEDGWDEEKGFAPLVDRFKRQLQESGRELDVTVRTKVTGDPKTAETVKLTFWTIPKIIRKPKDKPMETPEGTEPVYDTNTDQTDSVELATSEVDQSLTDEAPATESQDEEPVTESQSSVKRGRGRFGRS